MYFEMMGITPPQQDNYIIDEDTLSPDENIILENMRIFSEVYYGKTKEIQAIEDKIKYCREKYQTSQMKFNTSRDREELEDLFCKAFGFECCSFHVTPSGLYNACTIPVCNNVFDFRNFSKYIISDGNGMKYKKEANVYLIFQCTSGLFYSQNFTAAEVTAVLLHEVGHNFQTAMSGKLYSLSMINKVLGIIVAPIIMLIQPAAGPLRNVYIKISKYLEKEFDGLYSIGWNLKKIIMDILGVIITGYKAFSNVLIMMNPLAVIRQLPLQLRDMFLSTNILNWITGTRGEMVADAFASSYGYSDELTTALKKMDKSCGGMVADKIIRDCGFIGTYFDLLNLPTLILSNIFDPHPATIGRLKSQVTYLENEMMSKENNPKMKKEIKKQISEINKTIDKYLDNTDEAGFEVSNAYAKFMLMHFNGDFRSGMGNCTNEEFDKAQAKAEAELARIKGNK